MEKSIFILLLLLANTTLAQSCKDIASSASHSIPRTWNELSEKQKIDYIMFGQFLIGSLPKWMSLKNLSVTKYLKASDLKDPRELNFAQSAMKYMRENADMEIRIDSDMVHVVTGEPDVAFVFVKDGQQNIIAGQVRYFQKGGEELSPGKIDTDSDVSWTARGYFNSTPKGLQPIETPQGYEWSGY